MEKIIRFIRGDGMGNPVMERFLNSQAGPSSYSGYPRQNSTGYNRTISQDSQRLDGTSSSEDNEGQMSLSSAGGGPQAGPRGKD